MPLSQLFGLPTSLRPTGPSLDSLIDLIRPEDSNTSTDGLDEEGNRRDPVISDGGDPGQANFVNPPALALSL